MLMTLSGPAEFVPLLDRLLRCVDHVHPVLQLWAPGVHEGPQHEDSQLGRRLWDQHVDMNTVTTQQCHLSTDKIIKHHVDLWPERTSFGCCSSNLRQASSRCCERSLKVVLWSKYRSLSPLTTQLRLIFTTWAWICKLTWTHTPDAELLHSECSSVTWMTSDPYLLLWAAADLGPWQPPQRGAAESDCSRETPAHHPALNTEREETATYSLTHTGIYWIYLI